MRTGLLGGTFDPIHYAHLFMAQCVLERETLDRVLFVPVAEPAHRSVHAPAADRAAMVSLAIGSNPRFALDDSALEQPGPAYTADTLALLRRKYPVDAFVFIAGADSLARSTWRRLDEVAAALEKFVIVSRLDVPPHEVEASLAQLPAQLRRRFVPLQLPAVDIAATDLRERVAKDEPIRYLTPDSVVDYIAQHRLYR